MDDTAEFLRPFAAQVPTRRPPSVQSLRAQLAARRRVRLRVGTAAAVLVIGSALSVPLLTRSGSSVDVSTAAGTPSVANSVLEPLDGSLAVSWLPSGFQLRSDRKVNSPTEPSYGRELTYTLNGVGVDSNPPSVLVMASTTPDSAAYMVGEDRTANVPGGVVKVRATGAATMVAFRQTASTVISVSSNTLGADDLVSIAESISFSAAECLPEAGPRDDGPCAAALEFVPNDRGLDHPESTVAPITVPASGG